MGSRNGRWIKLPVWWIHKGIEGQSRGVVKGEMSALPGLREFKPTDRANSVAALKLYIILLARTNNQASDPGYATSSLSITEIYRATGLSREKIVAACRI